MTRTAFLVPGAYAAAGGTSGEPVTTTAPALRLHRVTLPLALLRATSLAPDVLLLVGADDAVCIALATPEPAR